MKTEEIIKFGRGAIYNRSGKKIADSLGGQTKIVLPVVVKHDHRLESSGTYHEKLYFARNVGSGLHIIMELYGRQIAVMDRSSVTIAVIN